MSELRVTIVVPNFNYGKYLGEALASIAGQTYQNWEAIVVDNFSTDNTDEVFKKFDSDSRFKMLKFSNNGSIAASRNVGIKAGSGDLIGFLDSDDVWSPKKLELSVDAHKLGAAVTYHNLKIIDENSLKVPFGRLRSWVLREPILSDLLLRGNAILNSSAIVTRQAISKVGFLDEDPGMAGAEDYNLWLKLAKAGFRFERISSTQGSYRSHSESQSQKDMSIPLQISVREFLDEATVIEKRRVQGTIAYVRGRSLYLTKDRNASYKYLLIALAKAKISLKLRSVFMILTLILCR